jgi:phytoene synthase
MCALYAFMRHTDDLADGDGSPDAKRAALKQWRIDMHAALAGEDRHRIHPALRHTLTRFAVPSAYLDDVIEGCESDVESVRMPDFATLYRYCYRVASAVGLACIHVWGYRDEAAKLPAEHAGIAFQLTNILRDLPEDLARERQYLPADELEQFKCQGAADGGAAHEVSGTLRPLTSCAAPRFRDLMRLQVARARHYYNSAERLTPHLGPPGRAVFQVMLRTYRSLLDEIERRDFDVFRKRVRLSSLRKARLVLQALPVRWGWI